MAAHPGDELSGLWDWLVGKTSVEHTTMLMQFPVLLATHKRRLEALAAVRAKYQSANAPVPASLAEFTGRVAAAEDRLNRMVRMIRAAVAQALESGKLKHSDLPANAGLGELITTTIIITAIIAAAIVAILLPLGFFDLYQEHQRLDNITAQMLATEQQRADAQIAAAAEGRPVPAFPPQTIGPGPAPSTPWGTLGIAAVGVIGLLVFAPLIRRASR